MSTISTLLSDPIYLGAFIINVITIVTVIFVFLYKFFTQKKTPYPSICILHLLFISILYSFVFIINFNINRQNSSSPKEAFKEPLCSIQAFSLVWLSYSREIWSLVIIFSCVKFCTEQRNITKNLFKFYIYTIPICYIFPFIIALVFYLIGSYGINNLSCWFKNKKSEEVLIDWLIKFLITLLIILFGIKAVIRLRQMKKKKMRAVSYKLQLEYNLNQIIFPICKIVDSIISTLYIIYLYANKNDSNIDNNNNFEKICRLISMYVSISLALAFSLIYLISLCNIKKYRRYSIMEKESGNITDLTEEDINEQSIVDFVNQPNDRLTESYYD